jgi:hypothetical protein
MVKGQLDFISDLKVVSVCNKARLGAIQEYDFGKPKGDYIDFEGS